MSSRPPAQEWGNCDVMYCNMQSAFTVALELASSPGHMPCASGCLHHKHTGRPPEVARGVLSNTLLPNDLQLCTVSTPCSFLKSTWQEAQLPLLCSKQSVTGYSWRLTRRGGEAVNEAIWGGAEPAVRAVIAQHPEAAPAHTVPCQRFVPRQGNCFLRSGQQSWVSQSRQESRQDNNVLVNTLGDV